jgi:hypothetical protein
MPVFFGVGWSGVLRGAGRFLLFFIGFDIIFVATAQEPLSSKYANWNFWVRY